MNLFNINKLYIKRKVFRIGFEKIINELAKKKEAEYNPVIYYLLKSKHRIINCTMIKENTKNIIDNIEIPKPIQNNIE